LYNVEIIVAQLFDAVVPVALPGTHMDRCPPGLVERCGERVTRKKQIELVGKVKKSGQLSFVKRPRSLANLMSLRRERLRHIVPHLPRRFLPKPERGI
jgi:hypothetical protein